MEKCKLYSVQLCVRFKDNELVSSIVAILHPNFVTHKNTSFVSEETRGVSCDGEPRDLFCPISVNTDKRKSGGCVE